MSLEVIFSHLKKTPKFSRLPPVPGFFPIFRLFFRRSELIFACSELILVESPGCCAATTISSEQLKMSSDGLKNKRKIGNFRIFGFWKILEVFKVRLEMTSELILRCSELILSVT